MKVKSILISQPEPESERSPYFDLRKKYNLKIDFRPFIHVEGVEAQDVRKEKISILEHSAVIFTSRNAVDHFFRLAEDMRATIPDSMKYFCTSEAIALYLQKYVVYRKRKIFHGKHAFSELIPLMEKHKSDRFLLPCSDLLKETIPQQLDKNGYTYTKAIFYKTVCSDLSDLSNVNYDMLVFFSPSGITSLFKNFPKFKQNKTRIAAFGSTTTKAVEAHGLNLDVAAPSKLTPSMSMAIESYVKDKNKK